MSPVSRGRKKKTTRKRKNHSMPPLAPRYQDVELPPDPQTRPRPKWYASSIRNVLTQVDALLTMSTPREIEQATAELLGAELHRAANGGHDGLRFSEWFKDLAAAAGAEDSEPTARLLFGMNLIAPPGRLETTTSTMLTSVRSHLPRRLRETRPVEAIGDVWRMRDAYGSRIALIAPYRYPEEDTPLAYLFDMDLADIPVALREPGLFDDVDQAAAAWRASVGDTAADSEPTAVRTSDELLPLACVREDDLVVGDESRAAMDNWFRVVRRMADLKDALADRGTLAIPPRPDLYHGFDCGPVVAEFAAWYVDRHGTKPDIAAVEALAEDWLEGVVPEVWHSVSPTRITIQLAMFADDWVADDLLTAQAKAVFPDWVRWNGERSGLPAHLVHHSVTIATHDPRRHV